MLANMTVKELKEIAKRMGIVGYSRLPKIDIVEDIEMNIQLAHSEALAEDAERFTYTCQLCGEKVRVIDQPTHMLSEHTEPTYTIPGTNTVLRGDTARIMTYHMTNVHRFNPSGSRDNDGRIRLTPKQAKRCAKKLRRFMKREDLWGTKVA